MLGECAVLTFSEPQIGIAGEHSLVYSTVQTQIQL